MNVEELRAKLSGLGETWADADAAFRALEDTRQSVIAQVAIPWLDSGKSSAYAESQARASSLVLGHLDQLSEARRAANLARVQYEVFRIYIDLLRTQAANVRAEMQL